MKVALYARVSTEEQAKHGISIDAQVSALRAWAVSNGHEVVGEYVDAGVSGTRPYQKRPELFRFMQSLGKAKVDALVFTKLDRFYRSVKLYYQAVDVLDQHGVAWVAIHENYETVSSMGRFTVNVMLSINEAEIGRTSERIKAVYDHKVALGEPINGNTPVGLKIEGKKLVPDEYAPAVVAAFEKYADTGSRNAAQSVLLSYGKRLSLQSVGKLLRNRLYIGEYRDNPNFCEPILPRELFNRVQTDLDSRSSRRAPTGRVYLFSGLMVCGCCGRKMAGQHPTSNRYSYYHCQNGHRNYKDCGNASYVREDILEQEVISALAEIVAGAERVVEPQTVKPQNAAAIQRKLTRLRDLYLEGDMTLDQYKLRRDELAALLPEKKENRPRIVLGDNFRSDYAKLSDAQKQVFFRRVLDRIVVSEKGELDVFFRDSYANRKATDVKL